MNSVVHFELPVDKMDRAKKFYKETFDWELEDYPGMDYVLATTTEVDKVKRKIKKPGAINGGMAKRGQSITSPSFAIEVPDVDKALKKIVAGGGSVVAPKMAVGEMGWMAYFKDPEGNLLSVWQNA